MDHIIKLYKEHGDAGYIGEEVTQYQHAMQCYLNAEQFLKENEDSFDFKDITPYEIKLGSFLHDVGHLLEFNSDVEKMGNLGVMNHEHEGSKYLKTYGFSDNICSLVKNHINTKRYLITKDNNYYNSLSGASKKTFEYQGGKMINDEVKEFEKDKLIFWHLKLRTWDDKSKSTEPELLKFIEEFDLKKIFYMI